LHIISDEERKEIIMAERIAIFLSAIIGSVMVIIYALPVNYIGFFSYSYELKVPFTTINIEIQIITLLYGFLLVIVELMLLIFLDIYNTHKIAVAVGFINQENKNNSNKKEYIINFGSQKNIKKIHQLGLDPFLEINKIYYIVLNAFYKLKATLSNYLIRFFLTKIAGRYATRIILDLAGVPVFAFWNAWATRKIIKEARLHLIGLAYINLLLNDMIKFRRITDSEKILIYDLLQFIVASKRDYHLNHFILSDEIINVFEIKIESKHKISDSFFEDYKKCDDALKKLITRTLILGFLLDGNISRRELYRLKELKNKEVVKVEEIEIRTYLRRFKYGEDLGIIL
jgi:hypothetical protein